MVVAQGSGSLLAYPGQGGYSLPQHRLTKAFQLMEDFEAQADWTNSGNITHADNAAQKVTGTKSQKTTITVAGSNGYIRKTVAFAATGAAPGIVRLRFYLHDANCSSIVVYLKTGAASNYWQRSIDVQTLSYRERSGVWCTADIAPSQWVVSGAPDWNLDITQIRLTVYAKAGQVTNVSFDSLYFYGENYPAAAIFFDDGRANVYNAGLPILRANRQVATEFIIGANINGVNFMTEAQMLDWHNAGCDCANHTMNHGDLTLLSDAQVQAQWTGCKNALDALGLTRASGFGACPGGGGVWNDAVITSTIAAGMSGLRPGPNKTPLVGPINDWFYLTKTMSLGNTDTLATAISKVDEAIANKTTVAFLLHELVASPATDTEWAIADFAALMSYIKDQKMPTLTISELYALKDGPLTIRHR